MEDFVIRKYLEGTQDSVCVCVFSVSICLSSGNGAMLQ